jgi:hypothetical protein
MTAFDVPSREVCVVARSRTNTPLQSLVLLNDRQFVECAQALAREVSQEPGEIGERIRRAFIRLTGREPDAMEQTELLALYHRQRQDFARRDGVGAATFLGIAQTTTTIDAHILDWAALTVTCQAIMNLDATIYKR